MRILYSTILLFFTTILTAQSWRIEGKIIDCSTKQDLHLVNVGIIGTTQGATSDETGRFSIEGLKGGEYTLAVSAMGYEERRIPVSIPSKGADKGMTITMCEKTIDLEQVVVTGTRTERQLKNVPIQTQLITAKTIEKLQITNFKDLLEYEMPGVEFTSNGGYANINMLGFGGKYVLFLVDGERMAGETFDNIDYNRVDMDNVQQVEVVKGANSSLYGSNAVGGVINIISRKPSKPIEAAMSARVGSNYENNYRASLGTKQKWGYASVTGNYKAMDPYLLKDTEPLTQWYENGTKVEQTLSETYIAGYTDYSITPKIGIDISKKLNVEVKGGYYFKERNPGGREGKKLSDQYYNYSGGLKANYAVANNQNFALSANYDRYDKFKNYKLLDEKEKNYENYQNRISGVYNYSWAQGHSLVTGAEFLSDNLMTYMFESDGSNAKRTAETYSAYLQQEYKASDKLTFVGGLRFDYHSQFKDHLTPRLSVMYKPAHRVTLRGGYSGGFRSPTLKELHTDWFHPDGGGFQIIGNKNMKAEKSNNFNVSAEISLGKTVITAMSQYSIIDDMVSTVWLNNDTVLYANIGNTAMLSNEITIASRLTKKLTVKGGYSYVHDNLGKKSLVRPHSATARVEYTPSIFNNYNTTLSFSGKYFGKMNIYGTGDLDDNDNDAGIEKEDTPMYKIKYEGYAICRLSFAQSLPFNFSVNAGINNLFDYKAKFASFYSSISPGRTFYVALKWNL